MAEALQTDGAIVKPYEDLTEEELEALTKDSPSLLKPEQIEANRTKREQDGEVNRMFAELKRLADTGYFFKDSHLDQAVSLIFTRLEPQERGLILELSRSILSRPIWQLFAGWYRQVQEQGMATGAIFDPSWEQGAAVAAEKTVCKQCRQDFEPDRLGQVFCSNLCGVAYERANPPAPTHATDLFVR